MKCLWEDSLRLVAIDVGEAPCCRLGCRLRSSSLSSRFQGRFSCVESVFRHITICLNKLVWSVRIALVLHEYKLFFLQVNKPRGENNVWLCTMQKTKMTASIPIKVRPHFFDLFHDHCHPPDPSSSWTLSSNRRIILVQSILSR